MCKRMTDYNDLVRCLRLNWFHILNISTTPSLPDKSGAIPPFPFTGRVDHRHKGALDV